MSRIQVNLEGVEPQGSRDFTPFPVGDHLAEVMSMSEEESSAGNAMLVWEWEGLDDATRGMTVKSYCSLLDDALGNLRQHGEALGLMNGEDFDADPDEVVGMKAILTITHTKRRNRDTGEPMIFANVTEVTAYEEPAAAPARPSARPAARAAAAPARPATRTARPAPAAPRSSRRTPTDEIDDLPF